MSSTRHKLILSFIAVGIILGGGIGFYAGLSGWGILAGIVLGIVGAAIMGGEAAGWALATTDRTDPPNE